MKNHENRIDFLSSIFSIGSSSHVSHNTLNDTHKKPFTGRRDPAYVNNSEALAHKILY